MEATTVGLGPFHPAINWRRKLWVAEVEFATEDEAIDDANRVVSFLDGQAMEYLAKLCYSPK